jgi:ABC-type transport system involved in multi-copper enzyme maturation permease subunit
VIRVWAVAVNTFKETIRNRILINILLFAIGLILLSLVIGDWSLNQQIKIIKDFGLSAMSIFGLLIAIFIGIRLMVQELEQKTIYIVASKPIHRWEIVTGKYLGLGITLAINVLLMGIALWGTGLLMEGYIDFGLLPAILLIYVEILLIVGFALFFSTFVSPTISAVMTLIVFITGHLIGILRDYVHLYPDKGFHWLYKLMYSIFPNLEYLNLKMAVVEHLPRSPRAVTFGLLYGIGYILIIHILTIFIFRKKDFK